MNVITELEAHFGVPFPPGYSDWSLKKYTDHREAKSRSRLSSCSMDRYLWVHEAEWIPPDEIPHYDLGRPNIIPGLIPFAFGSAGDHWCWNTRVKNGDAEYEVLCCWHDEKLADRFAPTFPAWFYRNCLDYASGAFDKHDADIEEARTGPLYLADESGRSSQPAGRRVQRPDSRAGSAVEKELVSAVKRILKNSVMMIEQKSLTDVR